MKLQQFFVLSLFAVCVAGCSSAPETNVDGANKTAVAVNANGNAANSNQTATTAAASQTPSVAAPSTDANSPNATIAAYYQAISRKDEAQFRKVLSQASLREWAVKAREDGEQSLVADYTGISSPPKKAFETRSEHIAGDVAIVEIKNSDTNVWTPAQLVRENGEWKMDLTDATANKLLQMANKK